MEDTVCRNDTPVVLKTASAREVKRFAVNVGHFSTSFDDVDQLQRLPATYAGGIWTDRIDYIAPAVHEKWPASR